MFVITRLSRAMRSLKHLLALADELRGRGVGLVILRQQIDTTTPTGRLVFHILAAIDEFQRELITEGTREGLVAARARGRTGPRPHGRPQDVMRRSPRGDFRLCRGTTGVGMVGRVGVGTAGGEASWLRASAVGWWAWRGGLVPQRPPADLGQQRGQRIPGVPPRRSDRVQLLALLLQRLNEVLLGPPAGLVPPAPAVGQTLC